MVETLYDCEADHTDELGFKEGERIVITKKMSKDWWVSSSFVITCMRVVVEYFIFFFQRGYILSDPSRKGIFPNNYVKIVESTEGSSSVAPPQNNVYAS